MERNNSFDFTVSVILPFYNAQETLVRALQSLSSQTFKDFEVVAIDDGSTDDSLDRIRKFESQLNIQLLQLQENSGVAVARNEGLKKSRGRYIAFLDADDYWDIEKLHTQVKFMREHGVQMTHMDYYKVYGNVEKPVSTKGLVSLNDQRVQNFIPNLTAMYDRKTLGTFYQEEIRHEDYAMWIEILKCTDSYRIPNKMSYYSVHPNSLSGKKFRSLIWNLNVKKIKFRMNLLQLLFSLFHMVYFRIFDELLYSSKIRKEPVCHDKI